MKRVLILLHLLLIAVVLTPPIIAEHHNDSFAYQIMADQALRRGSAPWLIHPLSYLGLYPFSDSPGTPLLAAMASLDSDSSYGVILPTNILLAWGIFALSLGIMESVAPRIGLRASSALATSITISPVLAFEDRFSLLSRQLVIFLFFSQILLILRHRKMALLPTMLMPLAHPMGFVLALTYPSYLLARRFEEGFRNDRAMLALVAATIMLIPLNLWHFLNKNYSVWRVYSTSSLPISGIAWSPVILSLSLGSAVLFPLVLALMGLVDVIRKPDRGLSGVLTPFLLSWMFIPFRHVAGLVMVPGTAPLAGKGLSRRGAVALALASLLLAASLGQAIVGFRESRARQPFLAGEIYDSVDPEVLAFSAFLLVHEPKSNIVPSNSPAALRVEALSGYLFLPCFPDLNLQRNILFSGLAEDARFSFRPDVWRRNPTIMFVCNRTLEAYSDLNRMHSSPFYSGAAQMIARRYSSFLVMEDARMEGMYGGWLMNTLYPSNLLRSLHRGGILLLDTGTYRLWLIPNS